MQRRLTQLADAAALRHLVKHVPRPVGNVVDRVGHLAGGGKLWAVIGAGLAATGARGRRTAGSALTAYVAATAIANGPAKWLTRRRRPHGLLLADLPRLGRQPTTSSMPSSHTAGATAFAVAAGIEAPATIPVVGGTAVAVAAQRLRAVRHYPTDVLAGAALGAAVGAGTAFASRRFAVARHRGAAASLHRDGWDADSTGYGVAMADPRAETKRTGSGGSSDGDTQPDDAGASGTFGDLESDESDDGDEKAADA